MISKLAICGVVLVLAFGFSATPLFAGGEGDCTDGIDNDGDGAIDCADPECIVLDIACIESLFCFDGADNDQDGLTDCDDPDCDGSFFCPGGSPVTFRRGDCNGSGTSNLTDAIYLLNVLFGGAGEIAPCESACDTNDSGTMNINDVIFHLSFMFAMGNPLPAPAPGCGTESTTDALSCASSVCP